MAERPPPLHLLIDFDGTLVRPNVAIGLVETFVDGGPAHAREVDEQLSAGAITLREAWARQVALLPPDRMDEMAEWAVENAPLREGAAELLGLLGDHGIPASIVSGGLDFYIHPVLRRHGIDLPVYADSIQRTPDGALAVAHPHGHRTCRLCGICKAQAVRTIAPAAVRSVFVGDGGTDRYAAEVADLVFARRRLKAYCDRVGVPYYPFEDFGPVTEQLRRWVEGREPLPPLRRLGVAGSPCPISQALTTESPGNPPHQGERGR